MQAIVFVKMNLHATEPQYKKKQELALHITHIMRTMEQRFVNMMLFL